MSLDVSNSGSRLVSALSNVASKLGGGGSWGLGDLFGSGATAGAAAGGLNPSSFVAGMHTGGLVGRGSTFGFTKSPSLFDGAPRFHTGGIVGLGHKETPIIAKDDKAVFPTVRMSDGNFGIRATGLTGGGGGGGGASFVMGDINVQAPPRSADPAADQEYSKAIGREIKEQVRGVVTEMIHEQKRSGGALRG